VNKGEGTCMVFVDYEFANGWKQTVI
jgi:hypothetical protein